MDCALMNGFSIVSQQFIVTGPHCCLIEANGREQAQPHFFIPSILQPMASVTLLLCLSIVRRL